MSKKKNLNLTETCIHIQLQCKKADLISPWIKWQCERCNRCFEMICVENALRYSQQA